MREKIGHLRCFVLTYAINLWPKPLHLEPPPGVENESVLYVLMGRVLPGIRVLAKIRGLLWVERKLNKVFLHFFPQIFAIFDDFSNWCTPNAMRNFEKFGKKISK